MVKENEKGKGDSWLERRGGGEMKKGNETKKEGKEEGKWKRKDGDK
jgi:hypothetical protein